MGRRTRVGRRAIVKHEWEGKLDWEGEQDWEGKQDQLNRQAAQLIQTPLPRRNRYTIGFLLKKVVNTLFCLITSLTR